MSEYGDALKDAMTLCASYPNAVFIGQAVACEGTSMFRSLVDVPQRQRVELPVVEDLQMGMATGIALAGGLPICIYPRINFLLLAVNQLVLHLDKLPLYSDGGYRPKVIIRTAVGATEPMHPGAQHVGDYTESLHSMLQTVITERLWSADQILPAYRAALDRPGSTLLVETMGA